MTDYSIEYLRRLDDAVAEFEQRFAAWMETQHESTHFESRGLFPTAWTLDGEDPGRVAALELEVARAAGTAAKAVAVTGAYINVAGIGALDPIANWSLLAVPKAVLTPRDVRTTAATVRGRLRAFIIDAEARVDENLPAFSPAMLHPIVWLGASVHWTTHQYRVAVREAAEALTADWRSRLGRGDVDGTEFWEQAFSSKPPTTTAPRLRWPGRAGNMTARSLEVGLEPLAKSLMDLARAMSLTVRNPATHLRTELTEQEALERLGALSFLARLLDGCEIQRAEGPTSL